MISLFEYLDNDVSDLLSEHISVKRKYNNVIKELSGLIEVNRCAKYLEKFNCFRSNNNLIDEAFDLRNDEEKQLRLKLAHKLLNKKRKTGLLEDWPTKLPRFYRNHGGRDKLRRINNENYIIEGLGWRLKIFPPKKNKYSLENLSLIHKNKKNKYNHR